MLEIVFYIVLGAIIGSFLSVCIYRIPYGREKGLEAFGEEANEEPNDDHVAQDETSENTVEDERFNIFYPVRSQCPHCQTQLAWYENIPVISWLLLRGKCSHCHTAISVRYPVVELLSAFFCVLSFSYFPLPTAILIYALCASLIVLSFIDIDYYILPNVITYPGTLIAAALVLVNHFFHLFSWPISPDLQTGFWGLLAGGGFLFAISEGYFRLRGRIGLGMGDVKLLAMTGILMGPEGAFATIFCGSFLGAIIGSLVMLLFGNSLKKPLPFGPYLALGCVLHIFLGPGFPGDLLQRYIFS